MRSLGTFVLNLHAGEHSTVSRYQNRYIVWGKTTDKSPPDFACYSTDGKLTLLKVVNGLCQHDQGVHMLPVMIDGRALLAVSCSKLPLHQTT